jgi:hypothetical protein
VVAAAAVADNQLASDIVDTVHWAAAQTAGSVELDIAAVAVIGVAVAAAAVVAAAVVRVEIAPAAAVEWPVVRADPLQGTAVG